MRCTLLQAKSVVRLTSGVKEAVSTVQASQDSDIAHLDAGFDVTNTSNDGGPLGLNLSSVHSQTLDASSLLGASSNLAGGSSSTLNPGSSKRVKKVVVNVVCSGRGKRHHIVAMVCSNSTLVLRYSLANAEPIVRVLPWFLERDLRIILMCFNPTAEWLVCITSDASVYLVPTLSLLRINPGTGVNGSVSPALFSVPWREPASSSYAIPSLSKMVKNHLAAFIPSEQQIDFTHATMSSVSSPIIKRGISSPAASPPPHPSVSSSTSTTTTATNTAHSKESAKEERSGGNDNKNERKQHQREDEAKQNSSDKKSQSTGADHGTAHGGSSAAGHPTSVPRLSRMTSLTGSAFGSLFDVTPVKTNGIPRDSSITQCIWWRTFGGQDYVIVSTVSGKLTFINLRTKSHTVCEVQSAVLKMELICKWERGEHGVRGKGVYKMLLLHTLNGDRMMYIEKRTERPSPTPGLHGSSSGTSAGTPDGPSEPVYRPLSTLLSGGVSFDIYPSNPSARAFNVVSVAQFPKDCTLSAQCLDGNSAIGVFDSSCHQFSLHDPDAVYHNRSVALPRHTYRVNAGRMYVYTTNFIYTLADNRVLVCSSRRARVSPHHGTIGERGTSGGDSLDATGGGAPAVADSKEEDTGLLQEVALDSNDRVYGVLSTLASSIQSDLHGSLKYADRAVFGELQAALPEGGKALHESASLCGDSHFHMFMLWTATGVHELCWDPKLTVQSVDVILDSEVGSLPWRLADATGCDIKKLYRAAADRAFEKGDYHKAASLYSKTNIPPYFLISKFVKAGCLHVSVQLIEQALRFSSFQEASIESAEARRAEEEDHFDDSEAALLRRLENDEDLTDFEIVESVSPHTTSRHPTSPSSPSRLKPSRKRQPQFRPSSRVPASQRGAASTRDDKDHHESESGEQHASRPAKDFERPISATPPINSLRERRERKEREVFSARSFDDSDAGLSYAKGMEYSENDSLSPVAAGEVSQGANSHENDRATNHQDEGANNDVKKGDPSSGFKTYPPRLSSEQRSLLSLILLDCYIDLLAAARTQTAESFLTCDLFHDIGDWIRIGEGDTDYPKPSPGPAGTSGPRGSGTPNRMRGSFSGLPASPIISSRSLSVTAAEPDSSPVSLYRRRLSELEAAFLSFLQSSSDLPFEGALSQLLERRVPVLPVNDDDGLLEHFVGLDADQSSDLNIHGVLRLAHSRNRMRDGLRRMVMSGCVSIRSSELSFLLARDYHKLLLDSVEGGHIFRTLPYLQQLEILLLELMPQPVSVLSPGPASVKQFDDGDQGSSHGAGSTHRTSLYVRELSRLVPHLDELCLVRLASFIDPLKSASSMAWASIDMRRDTIVATEIVELFVQVLLQLDLHRSSERERLMGAALVSAGGGGNGNSSANGASSLLPGAGSMAEDGAHYSIPTLLSLLNSHAHMYRPLFVIRYCEDWKNFAAAAHIHELNNQWADALGSRIQHAISKLHGDSQREYICSLFSSHVPRIDDAQVLARFLLRICTTWHTQGWSVSDLEEILLREDVLPFVGGAFAAMMFEGRFDDQLSTLPPFSPKMCLAATRERLKSIHDSPSLVVDTNDHGLGDLSPASVPASPTVRRSSVQTPSHSRQYSAGQYSAGQLVSTERLWSEVAANLHKHVADNGMVRFRPGVVFFPREAAVGKDDNKREKKKKEKMLMLAKEAADKCVVFTCGHIYLWREFIDRVLPSFEDRMDALPFSPVPHVKEVILRQYRQDKIGVACPICVHSVLLQEQSKQERLAESRRSSLPLHFSTPSPSHSRHGPPEIGPLDLHPHEEDREMEPPVSSGHFLVERHVKPRGSLSRRGGNLL